MLNLLFSSKYLIQWRLSISLLVKPTNQNRAGFRRITPVKPWPRYYFYIPNDKKEKKIDFELWLMRQTGGNIVKSPDPASFEKFLHAVTERAAYYDNDFTILENCLESISAEDLIRNHASWQRECYQDTVQPAKILRAKKRYDKQILPEEATFCRYQ